MGRIAKNRPAFGRDQLAVAPKLQVQEHPLGGHPIAKYVAGKLGGGFGQTSGQSFPRTSHEFRPLLGQLGSRQFFGATRVLQLLPIF